MLGSSIDLGSGCCHSMVAGLQHFYHGRWALGAATAENSYSQGTNDCKCQCLKSLKSLMIDFVERDHWTSQLLIWQLQVTSFPCKDVPQVKTLWQRVRGTARSFFLQQRSRLPCRHVRRVFLESAAKSTLNQWVLAALLMAESC